MSCTGMWTVDDLKDMIGLLQQANFKFDPTDVDTDLHKRVSSAILADPGQIHQAL